MADSFADRLKNAWNAFASRDPPFYSVPYQDLGYSSFNRPDRPHLTRGNERSIINAIFNRIALDCASITIEHAKLNDNDRYLHSINSGLNHCLTLEANRDQTGRAFMQDIVLSMFDEGCVAVVPIDTKMNPDVTGSYDILTMRTGKITEWFPNHVRVKVYNERKGYSEEIICPKSSTAIIENPLYTVMNEPNSTLKRLIHKLNLLDAIDEQSGSGKLDLIIQLPYVIKTEARKRQAEERRIEIERQLAGSKYGIAYTDGTEHITQLNRAVENNLMGQIEFLTNMLYGQLGITASIMDGTADDKAMLNYNSRTVEPIMAAITDEYKRKFLTRTARSQHQSIVYFRDPFKLVPVNDIAEIADKFTRNEIMSSNEVRQIVGLKPVEDTKADELRNKNLNVAEGQTFANVHKSNASADEVNTEEEKQMNEKGE